MCSRSVLVHCPSCLGAATAVLAAEVRCCDGVLATWAREHRQAAHHLDRVMSHSLKSSPLSNCGSEPKLPKLQAGSTSAADERVSRSQVSVLFCASRVMAIARDFCLLRPCFFAELGTI